MILCCASIRPFGFVILEKSKKSFGFFIDLNLDNRDVDDSVCRMTV